MKRSCLVELGLLLVERSLQHDPVLTGVEVEALDLRRGVDAADKHLAQLALQRAWGCGGVLDRADVLDAEASHESSPPFDPGEGARRPEAVLEFRELRRLAVERALQYDAVLARLRVDRFYTALRMRRAEDHLGDLAAQRRGRSRGVLDRLQIVHTKSRHLL